jgi:chemotaxis methyl-accepting protein methylase
MSLQPLEGSLEGSLEGRVGLRLDRAMRVRLNRYAREAAQARNLSLTEYTNLIRGDDAARQALVDQLVVPTTSFFRHPEQFEALRRMLADWRDPLTIWCAGCSTGQEAYSLAILLKESGRQGWRVVASDVSTEAVERTAAGVYDQRELGDLGPERLRFLERKGGPWQVTRDLRERVTVVHHNLVTEDPPREARGALAVFCRNVLIYMGPEAQRGFLDGVSRLPLLQVLFLGATESLWGVTDQFVPVTVDRAYAYRPSGRRALRADRPPAAIPSPLPAQKIRGSRGDSGFAGEARVGAIRNPHAPDQGAATYIADGEAALAAGDAEAAVAAFRKACYLDADDPFAHLHLALALEKVGDGGARRAFAAARSALTARGTAVVESELEGFRSGEVLRLIEHRLGPSR